MSRARTTEHGMTMYNRGCRCSTCAEVVAEYQRSLRARKATARRMRLRGSLKQSDNGYMARA